MSPSDDPPCKTVPVQAPQQTDSARPALSAVALADLQVRHAREAVALRENLHRRKASSRASE